MKRTPFGPRESSLKRVPFKTTGGGPKRSTPMKKSGSRKTKADKANECPELLIGEGIAKETVSGRSGGWCEIRLPGCFGRALDWHHRQNRTQGGLWQASNGIHGCRFCHEQITNTRGNRALYEFYGWIVPSRVVPAGVKTLIHCRYGHTWVFLDDQGDVTLAPFPESVPGDPFTLPVPAVDDVVGARKRGVA
jgi:hypothetical protein